jgi:hypothetical protein
VKSTMLLLNRRLKTFWINDVTCTAHGLRRLTCPNTEFSWSDDAKERLFLNQHRQCSKGIQRSWRGYPPFPGVYLIPRQSG